MSQKRKRPDLADSAHDTQRPPKRKPFNAGKPPRKSNGKRANLPQSAPKATSASELKSRIRNLRRLLEHVESEPKHKMPANVRIERERELEACEHELVEKRAGQHETERRRKMISKYHQVRFFDRQKATRILKQLRRQLTAQTENAQSSGDGSDTDMLLQKIHNAEVAVNYAIFYPLMKPYSSLYPRSKRTKGELEDHKDGKEGEAQYGDDSTHEAKGDPDMWEAVERAMGEGTLDDLRNSEVATPAHRPREHDDSRAAQRKKKDGKRQSGTAQRVQTDTKAEGNREEEDESDGGFFE